MSFFSTVERLVAIERLQVVFDSNRCLHALDKFSECKACFDVCPAGAIALEKSPALNTENCQSCLACLPACPVGAFHADDATASLLNCVGRIESGSVELICSLHSRPDIGTPESLGIRIPSCLAGLGAGTLLMVMSLGLEKVVVRTDACKECIWGGVQPQIEKQVSQTQLFLAAWNKSNQILCVSKSDGFTQRTFWDSKNPPLSRRDMFRLLTQQGKIAAARAMESGQVPDSHNPGRDRMRLLAAIDHLPAPMGGRIPLTSLDFARVTASETCTACGVCGRACPTGALRFEKNADETAFALKLDPRNCIGCDICEHVCAPLAIHVDHRPLFSQIFDTEEFVLREGELVKCQDCGTSIAKQENVKLCLLCAYRREHPFGSVLPFGIRRISKVAGELGKGVNAFRSGIKGREEEN